MRCNTPTTVNYDHGPMPLEDVGGVSERPQGLSGLGAWVVDETHEDVRLRTQQFFKGFYLHNILDSRFAPSRF